ncbi:hypothetical protein ACRAWF_37990 [Streptomyces sp. L7]
MSADTTIRQGAAAAAGRPPPARPRAHPRRKRTSRGARDPLGCCARPLSPDRPRPGHGLSAGPPGHALLPDLRTVLPAVGLQARRGVGFDNFSGILGDGEFWGVVVLHRSSSRPARSSPRWSPAWPSPCSSSGSPAG